jgi:hypothetical protein
MKKILTLTVAFLMVTAFTLKASNPIPSFNIPISEKTYFLEDHSGFTNSGNNQDEKRDMNISNGSGNSDNFGTSTIVIYIYRLDNKKASGPYRVAYGQTISIPIDNQEWGVTMDPTSPTLVSVWID